MAAVVKTNAYKQNTLDYSQEGLKTRIRFLVTEDAATGPYGTGTLYSAIGDAIGINPNGLPNRGETHPYFNGEDGLPLLQADVIHSEAVDETTLVVDVDYAVLNGVTQEPSDAGDTAAALLTVASSLQSYQAIVDYDGNPINVQYLKSGGTAGGLTINLPSGTAMTGTVARPAKINAQNPFMILRFQRREQQKRDGSGLVGLYNGETFDAGDFGTFPPLTLLMTRVENVTRDEGVSWIVTYEMAFQYTITEPSGGVHYQSPAIHSSAGEMSAWDAGLYYVLPSSYSSTAAGGVTAVGPDMTPSDAIPTIFAVYGQDAGAFAALSLMG